MSARSETVRNYLPDDCQAIIGPVQRSDEWYNLRQVDRTRSPIVVFGASDAAVICGASPYKSPLKFFYEKIALHKREPATRAMEIGSELEPFVLSVFCRETGVDDGDFLSQPPMMIHPEYPFIGASLDALWSPGVARRIVEAKTTTPRMFNADEYTGEKFGEGESEIPVDYMFQVQCQMMVTGVKECYMAVMFDTRTIRYYKVPYNQDVAGQILMKMEEMYLCVENETEPEVDYTSGPIINEMKQMHGVAEDKEIWLSDESADHLERYLECKEKAKSLEALAESEMTIMLAEIGDAHSGIIPGTEYRILRKKVEPKLWTEEDILTAQERVGSLKRKGYVTTRVLKRK